MAVHRELGPGFLEAVSQAALAIEFQDRDNPYKAEVSLPVRYKSKLLTCAYRADFICFDNFLVETKALANLTSVDAQLLNELKATGYERGLLLNFGSPSLEYKRVVRTLPENLRQSANDLQEITL